MLQEVSATEHQSYTLLSSCGQNLSIQGDSHIQKHMPLTMLGLLKLHCIMNCGLGH